MPDAQLAATAPAPPSIEDGFDLRINIIRNDEECAESGTCDTSDGCSSTCPSACASS